jgi:hypothetical protein
MIQNHGMPAMKNITPHVLMHQHGLAEVRLRHQQRHDQAEHHQRQQIAGNVGLAPARRTARRR